MHIMVRNVSLACDFDGQEMDVRLNKGKWLHEGMLCFFNRTGFCCVGRDTEQTRDYPYLNKYVTSKKVVIRKTFFPECSQA